MCRGEALLSRCRGVPELGLPKTGAQHWAGRCSGADMDGSVPTFPGHEHVPVQLWIRQEGFVCPSPAALAAGADLPVDEQGAPTSRTGTGQTTETISRFVSFGWSLGKLWEDIKGRGSTKANSSSSCSSSSTGLVVASSSWRHNNGMS